MTDLKTQIRKALQTYADNCMAAAEQEKMPVSEPMKSAMELMVKQAMLSGMSLTSHFFAANEGHAEITPQAFEKAALEVGAEMDLVCEQLATQILKKPEEGK